jgi:hypothetical protein
MGSHPTDPGRRRPANPWVWVPVEIGIVVVGILVAFGLNSWYEGRQAAGREAAHLAALASDFAENVMRLDALARQYDRISGNSLALLRYARRADAAPSDSVLRLLGEVFSSGRFDPVMGAYQGLVHSGGLAQLRDDSLRAGLATFASLLDSRYAEHFDTELYVAFNREFVGRVGTADLVLAEPEDAEADEAAAPAIPLDTLLPEPRFQDYLALRHLTARDVARFYHDLGAQAAAVLERIEELVR